MKKNFLARIYEEGEFKVKNVVVEKNDFDTYLYSPIFKENEEIKNKYYPQYIIFDRKTGFAIVHADSKKECIQKYEKAIERFRTLQKSKNYQIYINEYLELCRNYCNEEVEKIDNLFYRNLTEKQKENLKKIKEFLEKENQKAREHQKIRGGR